MGFFAIPGAGGGFFLSAWLVMVFWGIIAPDLQIPTISYTKSMLVTIALWLAVAPLFWSMTRRRWFVFWQ